ncbi:MAG: TldD/PmbA family protein [Firmicutes bacterium]|nr:TldD/PmbA family protein [Bacillota bacterium]
MKTMEFREFKDKLFKAAREAGFTDFEVYYALGESFKVTVYQKEIDNYSVNVTKGLGFRGIYNGRMGYAYTEILDEESVNLLVKNAKTNAIVKDNDDLEVIYRGDDKYIDINCFNEELPKVGENEKIRLALEMETMALEKDKRVKDIKYCGIQSFEGNINIVNSKGLDLSHRANGIYAVLIPVVQDGDRATTSVAFKSSRNINDIKVEDLVNEAVEKALAYIGAGVVKTGKYKVVLNNEVASDLLETYADIFSADKVQKGMSLLKNKTGKIVGSKTLTIIDDPLLENGMASTPFDGEGVACHTKEIVREGQLVTLLHNLRTALKDGVKSTGNASRPSYSSTIDISPTNFYVKAGELDLEELLRKMQNGLLITELQGLHSGANTISGDFSLAAKGFEILNGEISRPIEQITIAGNFYQLMLDIEEVGNDIKFGIPSGGGCFGSPSLLIRELSVAG